MNKKTALLISGVLLAVFCSDSAFSASMYWLGANGSDWTDPCNWGGTGAAPTSADWVDVRSDTWYGNFPEVSTGQSVVAGQIRMNPGYGPETPTITMNGGTLTTSGEIYVGNVGGPAEFIMNSGTVNVGFFTAVGNAGGTGRLYMNGGMMVVVALVNSTLMAALSMQPILFLVPVAPTDE